MNKGVGLWLLLSALAGCGHGSVSVADVQAKCMRGCQRANSTCGSREDCAMDCGSSSTQPAVCLNEGGALFDCALALSDDDFCTRTTTACAAQEDALSACFAAVSTPDAATGDAR